MALVTQIKTLSEPYASVKTITPEMASRMLAADQRARENQDGGYSRRTLRKGVVDIYARDMAKDSWRFTGEALKFGTDGSLLDGQHRLHAVVKSNRTLTVLVIEGLNPEVQEVMDTGARRTPGDVLRMRGESGSTILAAVAKMIISKGGQEYVRPSSSEILAVVDNDPYLRWVVTSALPPIGALKKIITPAVLGYTYWRLHQIDEYACAEFFTRLDTLTNLSPGSPILALNRRLTFHERKSDGSQQRREAVTYVFLTWNAWRKGEDRTIIKLPYGKNGNLRTPEPI